MKRIHRFSLVLLTGAMLLAASVQAEQQNVTNRLTLSARFGFNISAKFGNFIAGPLAPATPRRTPNGDSYNYDDGYVLPDVNQVQYGYNDGLTWYWGYDSTASQVSGNTILFNRYSGAIPSSSSLDSDPRLGFELTYNRELGQHGDLHYGIEAAVNYMNYGVSDNRSFVVRVTDAYPFEPGTTPPFSPDPVTGPFQGSYQGGQYLSINNTPISSTTNTFGARRFDSDIWGFRLGPYLEASLCKDVNLSVSGGLAIGLLDSSASYVRSIGTSSTTIRGSDFDVLWGAYLSANVAWQLNESWSVTGGMQYQYLGTYRHSFNGQPVELDLSDSLFIVVGLGFTF